jgi:sugar lactone lactonase YvrE
MVMARRSCFPRRFAHAAAAVAAIILISLTLGGDPAVSSQPAPAGRTVRTVATFDIVGGVPGVPEGITADEEGGFYVSLFLLDEVWHVNPATGETRKVADVPGGGLRGDLIGIERDPADGTILATFRKAGVDLFTAEHEDCRDATDTVSGIYRLDPRTGAVAPFVTRASGIPLCFADDIAIDSAGNIYASDLELGVIWRFDRSGRGGVWSDDPLLGWTEQTGTWNAKNNAEAGYIGVNSIALSPDGRTLYAGTDGGPGGSGLLVRIPVQADGSAGMADLMAVFGANDGVEVGPDGTIYYADTSNNDVWAVSPDGSRRLLVASETVYGDPLDNATSLLYLNGCLYNTQLGFFKLQTGALAQTNRSVVEICNPGNPATQGTYQPTPLRNVAPPSPRPPSARPTHPLLSGLGPFVPTPTPSAAPR